MSDEARGLEDRQHSPLTLAYKARQKGDELLSPGREGADRRPALDWLLDIQKSRTECSLEVHIWS